MTVGKRSRKAFAEANQNAEAPTSESEEYFEKTETRGQKKHDLNRLWEHTKEKVDQKLNEMKACKGNKKEIDRLSNILSAHYARYNQRVKEVNDEYMLGVM